MADFDSDELDEDGNPVLPEEDGAEEDDDLLDDEEDELDADDDKKILDSGFTTDEDEDLAV